MVSDNRTIVCTDAALSDLDAELVILPVFEDETLDGIDVDAATAGEVSQARARGEFRGKPYELFVTRIADQRWRATRLGLIGAGSRSASAPDHFRRLASAAALAARQRRAASLAFVLREADGDLGPSIQAIAEGLTLAEFDPAPYKTKDDVPPVPRFSIGVRPLAAALQQDASRGQLLGRCTNLARGLGNEPGNKLTPANLAERAVEIAGVAGIDVQVLDERAISELGMGLLLGVACGSAERPRVIVMRYDPPGAPDRPVLGLVGKGITFDSGGISIKPADGMERMKDDMAGGAAVICAMRAIGMLRPPIRVVAVVPATENMPGGRALKPGDVLQSAAGKTVEVVNTDAEGRLVLGDALWYAQRLGATHLVDIATLTGACMVALGKITSGIFGRPDGWVDTVRRVALREGDRVWPLPLFDEYAEQLRSDVADMVNSAGRPAGAVTAAMFLKEFTGDLPWAHLDIAGTAWNDEARPYLPKGASGVGVRTLAELPFTSEVW